MSGEIPKVREAQERMTRKLVDGGMRPDQAQKVARDAAVRADRKERDKR